MKIKNLLVILILFGFLISTEGFLLHGPAGPLTAQLRGDLLLPCFADRPLPLEELEVEWRRIDSDNIVHLFQKGQSRPGAQGDTYRDRAHFFSQEIPKGNFSLLLENVRSVDAGVYRCVVYTDQENHDTLVEIREVERLVVTGTDEPVYGRAGEDVTLSCSVDTHVNVTELQVEWTKTDGDILVLLYAEGKHRPEAQDGRYSGRAEFFSEEIPKGNFSMKLSKVRTEDKGEFMCKVSTDTDSANMTVWIQALGFSSLHHLILFLCITAGLVVLPTGALSVWKLMGDSREALWCHCLHVTVPSIMISLAFILWGLTEGSTDEAVTCTLLSLLNILLLFNVAPYDLFPGILWRTKYLLQSIGSIIIMICVSAVPLIQFSTQYSTGLAFQGVLGVFIGGFVVMIIFMFLMQIVIYRFMWTFYSLSNLKKALRRLLIAVSVFLVIMVLAAVGVGVFLAQYFSDAAGKAEIGPFIATFTVPMVMNFFTFAGVGIFMVRYWRRRKELIDNIERRREELRLIRERWREERRLNMERRREEWRRLYKEVAVITSRLFAVSNSFSMIFNMQILALYNQIIAWIHNKLILEYFIPIAAVPLLICACIFAKVFLHSFRHFYLCQKILLVILFIIHLILSFQYLNLVLENDKGRPVKMCEYLFIYTLILSSCFQDWRRCHLLVKPRKYVYLSGAFGLPLVNSVGLAAELILKADTGKQTLDLRLVVLISGSLFLFSRFIIQISAYYMHKKEKIKRQLGLVQRRKGTKQVQRPQNTGPDQEDAQDTSASLRPHESLEMEDVSTADGNGQNTE